MRFATLERDYWQLRSAEESHRQHPDTFWILDNEARQSLRCGQAAKLIFDIEAEREDGTVERFGERMWVLVTERVGDRYIGILDNVPALGPSPNTYLCLGAEIPFGPQHVCDILEPPEDDVAKILASPPTRRWDRE